VSKYHNRKTEIDGFLFDSAKEAERYSELRLLERSGEISEFELQPKFHCVVNEKMICSYIADFRYRDMERNVIVVEDVKGMKTPVYRLKKKLVEALHGIKILEV
jgi:hypothetical protein